MDPSSRVPLLNVEEFECNKQTLEKAFEVQVFTNYSSTNEQSFDGIWKGHSVKQGGKNPQLAYEFALQGIADHFPSPEFQGKLDQCLKEMRINREHAKTLERWGCLLARRNFAVEAKVLARYTYTLFAQLNEPLRGMKAFGRCALAIHNHSNQAMGKEMIVDELRPKDEDSKNKDQQKIWMDFMKKRTAFKLEERRGWQPQVLEETDIKEAIQSAATLAQTDRRQAAKSLVPFILAYDQNVPEAIYAFVEKHIKPYDKSVAAKALARLSLRFFERDKKQEAFICMAKAVSWSRHSTFYVLATLAFMVKEKSEALKAAKSRIVQKNVNKVKREKVYNPETKTYEPVYTHSSGGLANALEESYKKMMCDAAFVGSLGWVGAAVTGLLPNPQKPTMEEIIDNTNDSSDSDFEVPTSSDSEDEVVEDEGVKNAPSTQPQSFAKFFVGSS